MYFWTSPGDDFTDGLGFRIQTVMYFSTSPDDDFTDWPSVASQEGAAGPASNLLRELGAGL